MIVFDAVAGLGSAPEIYIPAAAGDSGELRQVIETGNYYINLDNQVIRGLIIDINGNLAGVIARAQVRGVGDPGDSGGRGARVGRAVRAGRGSPRGIIGTAGTGAGQNTARTAGCDRQPGCAVAGSGIVYVNIAAIA